MSENRLQFKCFTFEPHKDYLANKCLYCSQKFIFKINQKDLSNGKFEMKGRAFVDYAKECCSHAQKHKKELLG